MKIIIAGAGAVGTHLARLLAKERHDITLVDEEQARLDAVGHNLDIQTYRGETSSIAVLKAVEVRKAHLFIAVTPTESQNITCCILAKKLGARRTVARVDNREYLQEDNTAFFQSIGIDSLVYPEMVAGRELQRNLRHSWVRQWWEVQGGQLILLGVKVRAGSAILNKPLREICGPEDPFHITIIKRGNDTLIPHGNDCILENDLAFFMTTPDNVELIRNIADKGDYPAIKNVFIMGAGNLSFHTAEGLSHEIKVKIFDTDIQNINRIQEAITNPRVMMINADATDPAVLREENIEKAQVFVASSENSEANILACLGARRLGVRKTVAIVENLDYVNLANNLDIGTIMNKKTFAASHIYRMLLRADVESVKSLTIAAADVAELNVKEGSKVTRKAVKDLGLPATINLGGFVRDGKGYLVNGNTTFEPGDTVVAFCLEGEIKVLERYFK